MELTPENEKPVVSISEEPGQEMPETADPPSFHISLEEAGPVLEEIPEEGKEETPPATYHRKKQRSKLKKRLKKLKKELKDLNSRMKKAKKKSKKKKARSLKKKLGVVKSERKDIRNSLQRIEEELTG